MKPYQKAREAVEAAYISISEAHPDLVDVIKATSTDDGELSDIYTEVDQALSEVSEKLGCLLTLIEHVAEMEDDLELDAKENA